jgi:hypothetical protein
MTQTTIYAGPCVMDGIRNPKILGEAKERLDYGTKPIAIMRDISRPYGIMWGLRAGSFKPRTTYMNGNGEKYFDGLEREGLLIHGEIAEKYGLTPISEIMSERDIPEFSGVKNMIFQIGARDAQNFALLKSVGLLPNDAFLKNDTCGYDPIEAEGSLQRLAHGSHQDISKIFYCIRGQKRPVYFNDISKRLVDDFLKGLYANDINQSPDYRNLNNIDAIGLIREKCFFSEHNISIFFDPSHSIGGKTEQTRRDIGKFAVDAITKYGYDGIMVEINIDTDRTLCDADQALPPSLKNIDWKRTQYGKKPSIKPYSLVDIVREIMKHKVFSGEVNIGKSQLIKDLTELEKIPYCDGKPSYL